MAPVKAHPAVHLFLQGYCQLVANMAVYLYETIGDEAAYAALGHCWGTGPFLRIMKANIASHMENGFALAQLPRNF